MSSIKILRSSTTEQQRQQCQAYITNNIQYYDMDDDRIEFLSMDSIKEIATPENVEAVFARDSSLTHLNLHPNARDERIHRTLIYAPRCFVAAMFAGLDMNFLIELTQRVQDKHLPILENSDYIPPHNDKFKRFMGVQKLVSSPFILLGEYWQELVPRGPLPLTSTGRCNENPLYDTYMVNFHDAHLLSKSIGGWRGNIRYVMKVFRDSSGPRPGHESWIKSKFGFVHRGRYHLCCEY
jgi:hypothetical protein